MIICKACNQKMVPTSEGFCPNCTRKVEAPGRKKIFITSIIIGINAVYNSISFAITVIGLPLLLTEAESFSFVEIILLIFILLNLSQAILSAICAFLGLKHKDNVSKAKTLVLLSRVTMGCALAWGLLLGITGGNFLCGIFAAAYSVILIAIFHSGAVANHNTFLGKSSLKTNSHL